MCSECIIPHFRGFVNLKRIRLTNKTTYLAVSLLHQTFANKSRRSLVYHPQLVAVYHQCGALYIIIAKAIQPTVDEILALSRYARQSG